MMAFVSGSSLDSLRGRMTTRPPDMDLHTESLASPRSSTSSPSTANTPKPCPALPVKEIRIVSGGRMKMGAEGAEGAEESAEGAEESAEGAEESAEGAEESAATDDGAGRAVIGASEPA